MIVAFCENWPTCPVMAHPLQRHDSTLSRQAHVPRHGLRGNVTSSTRAPSWLTLLRPDKILFAKLIKTPCRRLLPCWSNYVASCLVTANPNFPGHYSSPWPILFNESSHGAACQVMATTYYARDHPALTRHGLPFASSCHPSGL